MNVTEQRIARVSEMQKWAIRYLQAGMSVIPVDQEKKPLIKWEKYQKEKATEKEVLEWFIKYPNANLAMVTGAISDKVVIDIDDPKLDNALINELIALTDPPIVNTPRDGSHLYYSKPMTEVRNATNFIPKVDFRGEGGYVLVPPSTNGNGKAYNWKHSIFDKDLTILPESIIKLLNDYTRFSTPKKTETPTKIVHSPCQHPVSTLTNADECLQVLTNPMFEVGRRDDDLFHIANCLVKGGAKDEEIIQIVKILANSCNPPFPLKDAYEKIKSALNRTERKERTITEDIKQWCAMQDGFFLIADLCGALNLQHRSEKNAAYQSMNRLVKEGFIEKFGSKSGCYRRIDNDISEMDWENAPTHDLTVEYPLGIERMVKTYPSNIIIVAGTSNSGKTTLLLDFARRNINKFPIHYFNSEMGLSELRMRLDLFQNCNRDDWKKVKFFERGENFDDVIQPDGINIIDYLEVLDDFWKIGQQIKAIHNKLNQGIAVIAIQKNKGAELGRGGALGIEKPRLYINVDYGKMKIIKAKNWRTTDNPNGQTTDFKISGGWKIIQSEQGWYKE